MKYEFLQRLFVSCSAEGTMPFGDGLNLPELYNCIDEARSAEQAFLKIVESSGLEFDKAAKLEFACSTVCDAYEMQGFVNGFRIGMAQAADLEIGKPPDRRQERRAAE